MRWIRPAVRVLFACLPGGTVGWRVPSHWDRVCMCATWACSMEPVEPATAGSYTALMQCHAILTPSCLGLSTMGRRQVVVVSSPFEHRGGTEGAAIEAAIGREGAGSKQCTRTVLRECSWASKFAQWWQVDWLSMSWLKGGWQWHQITTPGHHTTPWRE